MKRYSSPEFLRARLPFSEAVLVGETLYVSGCLGNVPGKLELVRGGLEAEAHQTMLNIQSVLAAFGVGFDSVAKCTVMLSDMSNWKPFNEVYLSYFTPGKLPARSAFGCTGLALGALVELECVAIIDHSKQLANS